jgi:hypothetical protein
MNPPATERTVIVAMSLVATGVCVYLLAHVVRRRDLPGPLQRIEIAWTAVSLGILLAALAVAAL